MRTEAQREKRREDYAVRIAGMTGEQREKERRRRRAGHERAIQRMSPDEKDESKKRGIRSLREWEKCNPGKVRKMWANRRLRKRYGMRISDYERMYSEQWGMCPICGEIRASAADSDVGSKAADFLCVDHCHDTGNVRALLCSKCNIMIGFASDDIVRLQNAIEYLQYFKSNPGPKRQHA